jgi:hypothetical protein
MSGDVERVAAVIHHEGRPIEPGWELTPDACGACANSLRQAQALLAPGGVVAGMVAEAWAGAADEPGEVNTVPTPSQLLRRLADADADQRLEWASRAIENAETVNRCFVHNHVGRIASLERQLRDARDGAAEVRARVERLADEWERKAANLAPDDDWGDTIGDTIAADIYRGLARKLRAALAEGAK